eukprot:10166498-Karenia_brevis.AAC.1
MVLMWPMDRLLTLWPQVKLKVYVDDAALQLRGPQRQVALDMPEVARDACELLQRVELEVSKGHAFKPGGKSGVITGSTWLRCKMEPRMRRLGIAVNKGQTYLGVDAEPGFA